jgi:hypothetical protein
LATVKAGQAPGPALDLSHIASLFTLPRLPDRV